MDDVHERRALCFQKWSAGRNRDFLIKGAEFEREIDADATLRVHFDDVADVPLESRHFGCDSVTADQEGRNGVESF